MASKVSLREFQESLLAKLQAAAVGPANASRLGVQVGTQLWLVNLQDISESLPVPVLTSVPRVQSWFSGATNIRGKLYGIVDFCQFAGMAPTTFGPNARLLLVHPKFMINSGIIVERVLGLRNITQMERVAAQGEAHPWIAAEYSDENGDTWRELDMQALTGHARFLNIALE